MSTSPRDRRGGGLPPGMPTGRGRASAHDLSQLDLDTALAGLGQALTDAVAEASAALHTLGSALADAGLTPDTPPRDVRARALWLRRHRNTGPVGRRGHRR